uniref:F-box domain-containing protein n=1 Tax=Setaria viridis TaxID=4556 RepID=A0A4V6DAS1_SETVI|nr:hypothetical protein SEVIR_2G070000v2 [Setaria viridis]
MDCSKRRAAALGDLPVDPLVEILCRVPAKSVCRFKCVSKAWRDLIADPHHRKKLPQAMQGLFCVTPDESSKAYSFSFIDLAARSVPLDIDPSFSFLTELPGIQALEYSITSSLAYIVCNPTTKEWEAVPPCSSHSPTLLTCTYLAFDPAVSSHFNLVQFQVETHEEFLSVHAYSSETGTWSDNQIDEQGEEGQLEGWHMVRFNLADPSPRCPFINGFLNLLVWDDDEMKIVALDVQGKSRRMIPVPHKVDTHEGKYKLSIWALQDYDTKEWVLKHNVEM